MVPYTTASLTGGGVGAADDDLSPSESSSAASAESISSTVSGFTKGFKRAATAGGVFHSDEIGSGFGRRFRIAHRVRGASAWNGVVPGIRAAHQWMSQLVYDMNHGFTEVRHANPFRVARRDQTEIAQLRKGVIQDLLEDIDGLKQEKLAIEKEATAVNAAFNRYFTSTKQSQYSFAQTAFAKQDMEEKLNDLINAFNAQIKITVDEDGRNNYEAERDQLVAWRQQLFDLETAWLAADAKQKKKEEQLRTDHNYNAITDTVAELATLPSSVERNRGLTNKYPAVVLGTVLGGPIGLAVTAFGARNVGRALWYGARGRLVGRPGYDLHVMTPLRDGGTIQLPANILSYQNSYLFLDNGPSQRQLYYVPNIYQMHSRAFPLPWEHYKNSYVYLTDTQEFYYIDREGGKPVALKKYPLAPKDIESFLVDDIRTRAITIDDSLASNLEQLRSENDRTEGNVHIYKKRILPEELTEWVKDYTHVESDPQSLRGFAGASVALPVVGSVIGGIGLANMGRAIGAVGRGFGRGIYHGAAWGYRPGANFADYQDVWRRESKWARVGMVLSFLPSFVSGLIARGIVDNAIALSDGLAGGWVSGWGLESSASDRENAGFDARGTWWERVKTHWREGNYSALLTVGAVGLLSYGLTVPMRGIFDALRYGAPLGFAPATAENWHALGRNIRDHWRRGNYGIAITTGLFGAVGFGVGAFGRVCKDLAIGPWDGLAGGVIGGFSPLNYTRYECVAGTLPEQPEAVERKKLYLQRDSDGQLSYKLKNEAGEVCEGKIQASAVSLLKFPENLADLDNEVEHRDGYIKILEKISANHEHVRFAQLAGADSRGTWWERAKINMRRGNVFSGATMIAFGAVGAAIGATGRVLKDLAVGFWDGLAGGVIGGFTPAGYDNYEREYVDQLPDVVKKGTLYLCRASDNQITYKVVNAAGEIFTDTVDKDKFGFESDNLPADLKTLESIDCREDVIELLTAISQAHPSLKFAELAGKDERGSWTERFKVNMRRGNIASAITMVAFGAVGTALGVIGRGFKDGYLALRDGFFGGVASAYHLTDTLMGNTYRSYKADYNMPTVGAPVDDDKLYLERAADGNSLTYKIKNSAGEICTGAIQASQLGYTTLPTNLSALEHIINRDIYTKLLSLIAANHKHLSFSELAGVGSRGTFWQRFKTNMRRGNVLAGLLMIPAGVVGAMVGGVGRAFHDLGVGVRDGFIGGGLLTMGRSYQEYKREYVLDFPSVVADNTLYLKRLDDNSIQYQIKNPRGEVKQGTINKTALGFRSTEKLPEDLSSFDTIARRETLAKLLDKITEADPSIRFVETAGFDSRGTWWQRLKANMRQGNLLSAVTMTVCGVFGAVGAIVKGACIGLYDQIGGGIVSGFSPLGYTTYKREYPADLLVGDNVQAKKLYLRRNGDGIEYTIRNAAGEIFTGLMSASVLKLEADKDERIPDQLWDLEQIEYKDVLQKVLGVIAARHDTIKFAELAGADDRGTFGRRTLTNFRRGNIFPAVTGFSFGAVGGAIGAACRVFKDLAIGFWDGLAGGVVSGYRSERYRSYTLVSGAPSGEVEQGKLYLERLSDDQLKYHIKNKQGKVFEGQVNKTTLGFSAEENFPDDLVTALNHIDRREKLLTLLQHIATQHDTIKFSELAGADGRGTLWQRVKTNMRRGNIFAAVTMAPFGLMGLAIGGFGRVCKQLAVGAYDAVVGGVISGSGMDGDKYERGTWKTRVCKQWRSGNYIQAVTTAVFGAMTYVAAVPVRGMIDALRFGAPIGFAPATAKNRDAFAENFRGHWQRGNYGIALTSAAFSIIGAGFGAVGRVIKDLAVGFWDGLAGGVIAAGAPLRYTRYECVADQLPVDNDVQANKLYLQRNSDAELEYKLKNEAGEVCTGKITFSGGSLPTNLEDLDNNIENRETYENILKAISAQHDQIRFSQLAGADSRGTLWERAKVNMRRGNIFSAVTMGVFGAIGAVIGATGRLIGETAAGLWHGFAGGIDSGLFNHDQYERVYVASLASQSIDKGKLYLERADDKVNYKILSKDGTLCEGLVTKTELDSKNLPANLKNLTPEQLSKLLAKISENHPNSGIAFPENAAVDGHGSWKARMTYLWNSGHKPAAVVTGIVGFATYNIAGIFRGIVDGVRLGTQVGWAPFTGKNWSAWGQQIKEHFGKGNIATGLMTAVVGAVMVPLAAVTRLARDFLYGLGSGFVNTFRGFCAKDPNVRGLSNAWRHHGKQGNRVAQGTMILGAAIAAPLAGLIGLIRSPIKIGGPIVATVAAAVKNVAWKALKAVLQFPVRAIGGLISNGVMGGAKYAFAKLLSQVTKVIPVVRTIFPAFRTWNIAMDPLKRQLDAVPSEKGDALLDHGKKARGEFLDGVSHTLLDALKAIQHGGKKLQPAGVLETGDGSLYRVMRNLPFASDKNAEQLLKRFHEYLLEGKVEFKGSALPDCMREHSSANSDKLPSHKFRFFSSAAKEVDTLASTGLILDGIGYQFKFTIENDKLQVLVSAKQSKVDAAVDAKNADVDYGPVEKLVLRHD